MNRKQRRAQTPKSESKISSADQIPLSQPPTNASKPAKTLYEIAAERQAALLPNAEPMDPTGKGSKVVNVKVNADGKIEPLDGSDLPVSATDDGELLSPIWDTILFSSSLSALHFTLTALTVHQYAQPEELSFVRIFWGTLLTAFPILSLLVHFMRGHLVTLPVSNSTANVVKWIRSAVYLAIANAAGCYLIYLTNDKGYMAVMKDAPAVGTVWVWTVIEMGLGGALAGVLGPGVFSWWFEYSVL